MNTPPETHCGQFDDRESTPEVVYSANVTVVAAFGQLELADVAVPLADLSHRYQSVTGCRVQSHLIHVGVFFHRKVNKPEDPRAKG